MIHRFMEILFLSAALCGTAYYVLSLWSAVCFRLSVRDFEGRSPSGFAPGISLLKPLKGTDREIYESFRSHCLQEYPEYEIIFGVSDAQDPAVPLVKRLAEEFPQHRIRLVVCPEELGTNRKVSNLIQMLPHAKHAIVLVNDSDIRVSAKYLKRVAAHFADENVGMVTTTYRGVSAPTLGSRLESIGIATDFVPGVLAARQIEGGLHFALGSTLAMRRDVLEKIGGFEAIVDYLADDFELGSRISRAGYEVVLASEVVDTFLPPYTLRGFLEHQTRWARSTRDSRKLGYAGIGLTFGLPWAFLAVLVSGGAGWSWWLLASALTLRLAVAVFVGMKILGDRSVAGRLWLVPVRDIAAIAIWAWSFTGDTILWRGDRFLLKDGKLYPATPLPRKPGKTGERLTVSPGTKAAG